jgi:hypothetical protein
MANPAIRAYSFERSAFLAGPVADDMGCPIPGWTACMKKCFIHAAIPRVLIYGRAGIVCYAERDASYE